MAESRVLTFSGGVRALCSIGDKLRVVRPVEGVFLEEDLKLPAIVIGFRLSDVDGYFVKVSHLGFANSPHPLVRSQLAVTWYADRFEPWTPPVTSPQLELF